MVPRARPPRRAMNAHRRKRNLGFISYAEPKVFWLVSGREASEPMWLEHSCASRHLHSEQVKNASRGRTGIYGAQIHRRASPILTPAITFATLSKSPYITRSCSIAAHY